MKRPSVTHLFMLLSQISGFLTLFFSILKNFNIEGAWETAYLIKIVFHTSFLVTVLTAPTESKLKNSERKYRTSYNRAEFYKDIFAHDVNNIFHNILAAMDLCSLYLDRLNNEKIIEIIELVRDQISKGGELVSNIKKLSEIKDYQGTLDFIKVDRYVRQCIKDVKQKYKQKQIKIQLETLDQDYWVKANKWLSDIFENILINAIEHNENDRIEIIIKVSKAKIKDVDYIKFEFIDNGPGIPKKMKLKVFQRAFGRKKDYFGLGLGLSLVKKIIENYNGYVWIEDRVKGDHSKGSNFVVLIPAV
jgi:signal transduction histidine kinase